jgi:NTE family protein
MAYHFKNLVFEGGGVKGITYVGALEELEKREIHSLQHSAGGRSFSRGHCRPPRGARL